ncbi:DNA polymerase III subunit beta [Candidatus Roizmanbacteria bacterium RIFCSPHIGHO2_12_FULL_37_9b]|uniref:Beta sliding clamp n=1 Tax=Candidatus Roizmanbacteria bacterium RIFCSPHIGHO2_02_FULL_38_11 TaxID=1802039 RepID=A0A1F7GYA8_9BACT|nr:MAG: DNA polymerase III subunit beta [Candidatus Roizmanbacteria bacterium RIFCSPHIGHO2_02_FULL_38_11]OGK35264.1 MAG: DNA polymerase III subunit beta [Candidatus Roizmanbacteria bacterium RIFCSPHIGHO2_12_FULL_37_9b]
MKIKLNREEFLDKLTFAMRFTSTKLSSLPILQGIYIKKEGNKLHLYSSNLNAFFHTSLSAEIEKDEDFVIEPKKTIEFLSFLADAKVELEVKDKQMFIKAEKTKGRFPLINAGEFPMPPKIEEKTQKIKTEFLTRNLPLVLFSASTDETRPALSGVNFLTNEELTLVSTDGFRLSLVKTKKEGRLPSVIIPADFLREITHFIKDEKEVDFSYSAKGKAILFKAGDTEFYSQLIEGDFPPFEKVIPQEKKTTVTLEKEEFLRNTKLISVFARDLSNIIVLEVKKNGVRFTPKAVEGEENSAFQDGVVEGEEQKVAFNYKFLLDFLNVADSKNIVIEILRSDAPVVFRMDNNQGFLHVIMPVRIQE